MNRAVVSITSVSFAFIVAACGGSGSTPQESQGGSPGVGGGSQGGTNAANTGGTTNAANTGGATSATNTGGATSAANTGGTTSAANTGGTSAANTGGTSAANTGGKSSTAAGGSPVGGATATGGAVSTSTGGKTSTSAGGKTSTSAGGTSAVEGGATGAGGTSAVNTTTATGGTTGVTVQLESTRQTIQGFGLNSALMPSDKSIPIDTIYGTTGTDGIGLSILRVGMNPDGSLTGKYVSEAKAKGAKVIGSTWSPPKECKSNGDTKNGGYLLESCFDSWATKIANFAQAQGLYAMSIANESDFASCPGVPVCTDAYDTTVYTAKQMVAWVKAASKKLRQVSPNTKIIAPEASEWIHVWSNLSGTGSIVASHPNSSDPLKCGCFSNTITAEKEATCAQKCLNGDGYDYGHWLWKDQDAWKAFDILGVHQYDSQIAYAWPADVNDGKRDREVWQTEMSGVMHWPEQGPSTDIKNGVAVAGWIHSALTVGEASAWLYWWYEAYYQNDNEGLALIQGSSTKAKRFYTLGNYSKFVRPGFVAVDVTGNSNANLLISAYKGTDGTVAVVAINKGTSAASVPISIAGGTASTCTPNVTSASDNLKAGAAVPVSGGTFTAALEATTVTTFVCK